MGERWNIASATVWSVMAATWMVMIAERLASNATEWVPPSPLSARQQIEAPAYVQIPPMTVTLRFVDPKDFYAKREHGYTGVTLWGPRLRGCTIEMPSGDVIEAWADHGFAAFANANSGPNIAHEILHCVSGTWHPGWDMIASHKPPYHVTEYYRIDAPALTVINEQVPHPDPRDMR